MLFSLGIDQECKKLLLAFKDSRKGKREREVSFPTLHPRPVPCPQMSVHGSHQVHVTMQILAQLYFLAALFILFLYFIYFLWGVGGGGGGVFGYKSLRSCWEGEHVWRSERDAHVRGLLLVVWCVCVCVIGTFICIGLA